MGSVRISKKTANFPVSFAFVDKFLKDANATFVKVYIYALRHAHDDSSELSVSSIAAAINILDSDVVKAFEYWDSVGAVSFKNINNESFELEFLDIEGVKKSKKEPQKPKKLLPLSQPSYSIEDVSTSLKNDEGIKNMFALAQQILNKTLNHNDLKKLYSFYDWYGLPKEVILMLLEYCMTLEKSNMQYIEKVACTWSEEGIDTLNKASDYIKKQTETNNDLKKIKNILNIYDRDLTPTELNYLSTWKNEYKASDDNIKEAYELTIINTGKRAFKYMDAVLKNGVNGVSNTSKPITKNSFSNYIENDDLSEFERAMLEKRMAKTNKM